MARSWQALKWPCLQYYKKNKAPVPLCGSLLQIAKIADNVPNGIVFWKEISMLNPSNKVSSNQIDDASDSLEISKLFHDKYRLLYSSVLTDTKELDDHNDINNGITPYDLVMITPAVIRQCVIRLKSGMGDSDIGFRSDH